MARISKADVHAALERVARNLKNAGGLDGIVSRKDARDALRSLEGTEQALTDVFYRFILARDAACPPRITRDDVDAVVAYAKTHVIDRYDLNHNGLSNAEIAAMSTTGRLAVALARRLKAAAAGPHGGEVLAKRISALIKGLSLDDFASESAQDLRVVHVKAGLSHLTGNTLRAALGRTADRPQNVIARYEPATAAFFERFLDAQPDEARSRGGKLVKILRESLRETTIIIFGRDDPELDPVHPVYVVGIAVDGDLVGFQSAVVWT